MILGKIKEEVKNIAKSRRDMIIPKPMEVDKVKAEWDDEAELTTTRPKTSIRTTRCASWVKERERTHVSCVGSSVTERQNAGTKAV